MIKEETKLFLVEKYKIIGFLVINFIIFFSIYFLVDYRNKEEEPTMKVGLVNYDDREELQYFLSLFNGTNFSKAFEVLEMNEDVASKSIENDEISAYIIIPNGFISSVYTGNNLSLTIIGNENDWIEVSIIKLIMNIAISYLTTAQSGIYATIDTLNSEGATGSQIEEIVMPINIAYGSSLLNFKANFKESIVNPTGSSTLIEYYTFSIIFFFMMISVSMFLTSIQEGIKKEILNRYKICGINLKNVFINKFIALSIVIFLYTFPILYLFKLKGILVILLTASIAFFIATITNENTGIISNLFISFFTLIISGGIIPLVFLPSLFNTLAKLTPNYWVININSTVSIIVIIIYTITLNIASYYIIGKRILNYKATK